MNRTVYHVTLACAGVLLLTASIAAQQGGPAQGGRGGGAPAGFQNLTVLPRDISQPQLIAVMRAFESALGVTCDHCHIYFGNLNPMNNMASDDKPAKKVTRVMMLAVRDFNATLLSDVGKPATQLTQAQCGTCHRGSAVPKYEAPPPQAAPAGGGGRQGGRGQ